MSNSSDERQGISWLPALAAIVALLGIGDGVYLTSHHYSGQEVPCSLVEGCDIVLKSAWSEIGGIPLALFGALAYFAAFSLALLSAFGNKKTWPLFGIQVSLMFLFSLFLLYQQAFVIRAFCQFCLISAAITTALFALFIFPALIGKKA